VEILFKKFGKKVQSIKGIKKITFSIPSFLTFQNHNTKDMIVQFFKKIKKITFSMFSYLRVQIHKKQDKKVNMLPQKGKSRFWDLIRGRIVIIFSLLIVILVAMLVVSASNLSALQSELKDFAEKDIAEQLQVNQLATDISKMANAEQSYVITGKDNFINTYNSKKDAIETAMKNLTKTFTGREEMKRISSIQEFYNNYIQYSSRVVKTRDESGIEKAQRLVMAGNGKTAMDYIDVHIDMMNELLATQNANQIKKLETQTDRSLLVFLILTIVSVLLALSFGIFLYKSIRRNTYVINSSILDIANAGGDLTRRVNVRTKDEFSQIAGSTNILIESIANLVKRVSVLAENVSASGQELLASADETSHTIQSIADTTNEIAAGSEQTMRSMTIAVQKMNLLEESARYLSEDAKQVKDSTDHMKAAAVEGGLSVQHSSTVMMSIEETMANTTETVEALGKKSNEITSIIRTITDIAGQTNLLALNAAIEAARAGEHGRGFAVVADEVRKLAVQSQKAAKEITGIVTSIQQEVKSIVKQNHDGVQTVIRGVEVANETNSSLEKIMQQTNATVQIIDKMVNQIEQTLTYSQEVASSFVEVNQIAENTASNSETSAAAAEQGSAAMQQINASAEELSEQAEQLRRVVNEFKL
jgi:methyl-accepting chemotaxis protein